MLDLSLMSDTFTQYVNDLESNCNNLPNELWSFLENLIMDSELQKNFSKPMVWIGIYIAIASLLCILPMLADLFHGFKNNKLWFPCKYFTLNAASLTIIAVAMKLPVDLNNPMPGVVDQAAKFGSMAFLCTMMANLLPSIATMDSKELLSNIIALAVLVITLVVNVCIQIETGVVSPIYYGRRYNTFITKNWLTAAIYVAMLIALLMIYTCSALMILKSKRILESQYKEGHEKALKDLDLQRPMVEKLKQHVSNHWIMARTGSPQFVTVCSATTSASGVLCFASTVLHFIIMISTIPHIWLFNSDYKWSILVILITQFTGVIIGTVAPLSRFFASLSFEVSMTWIRNHITVFKVESYYIQKFTDWKQSNVSLKIGSRKCKIIIQDLKVLILSIGIGIQKTVVVACKMLALIPIFFVISVLCFVHCWNWLKVIFGASYNATVVYPTRLQHKDLSCYVLQLQDDIELAERTWTSISNSVNHVIQKAETQKPNNLMKLLEESSGFEGVGRYDVHQVPPLSEEKYVQCWSLPVVTLTAIAVSLPNIQSNIVDRLLSSVNEGLTYVKHVEETLNATDQYVSIQKAARTLWLEVEVYHKWLGNKLPNPSHQVNATKEIVQWFRDTSKNVVTDLKKNNTEGLYDTSMCISISANSMYRITQTMLVSYHASIDQLTQEELFLQLSSMISHILAACLTNLPRVIAMKCHTSVIEKREASVHTAAQLFGETVQIINILQDRQLPSLDPDELPFIDKWRDCFLHLSP